jgi:hypothetical protein
MSSSTLPKNEVRPRFATSTKKLCSMVFDNVDLGGDFWGCVDETTVTLCEQTAGQEAKNSITIPRRHFNDFVDWYNLGRIPPGNKKRLRRTK